MHQLILGRTGAGKSTLIENELIESDGGFTLLDPHGQTAEALADKLPNIIYGEPFNPDCPIAFNILADVAPERRHLVAEQVISSIKSAYPDSWGPNLEDILRNALHLLIANSLSLPRLPQVLTDKNYRTSLLRRCPIDAIKDFWGREFPSRKNPDDELRSTLNKVRIFATDPNLRRVLSHNTLNLARVMNKGQRLVFNLSVSLMGEKPASLLGALLINGVYHAALSRSAIPEQERVPHHLVVDEWQNFATTTFANILAEARKYRLSITLLNQYTTQVDPLLFDGALANVGRLVVFSVSGQDSQKLTPEFGLHDPVGLPYDTPATDMCDFGVHSALVLATSPKFQAYVKDDRGIYALRTEPPHPPHGYLNSNRRNTRARYRRSKIDSTPG